MSHRTQITLTDEQYKLLHTQAKQLNASLAELIRRAIDATYYTAPDQAIDILGETAGAWDDFPQTGEEFTHQIRPGWQERAQSRNLTI